MSQLDKILAQEVTRKQFIMMLLSAVAALFGISAVLGALTRGVPHSLGRPGYGEKGYGP